jgi:hypothetical protein
LISLGKMFFVCLFVWWCLMPLSTIFQLDRDGQFYWWRKSEDLEKTTNLSQVADKLSHNVVNLAMIEIQTHNISGDRHWVHTIRSWPPRPRYAKDLINTHYICKIGSKKIIRTTFKQFRALVVDLLRLFTYGDKPNTWICTPIPFSNVKVSRPLPIAGGINGEFAMAVQAFLLH